MEETKLQFLNKVDKIISLIRENAVKRLNYKSFHEIQENSALFYIEVHKDFAEAQNIICEGLLEKEEELEKYKNDLKSARQNKNKNLISELKTKLIVNHFRQLVYRKLADSIAWQLINGQHYIARRLFINHPPPVVKNSNITDVMNRVNELNKIDGQSFALISDLTSFIQIGDILWKTPKGITLIEAKEGEKNETAREILDLLKLPEEANYDEAFPPTFNHKMKEQIKRIHRQDVRAIRAADVINNNIGTDPVSGKPMIITEVNYEHEFYFDDIERLIKESKEKDWAYDIIDECLHIGAYRNNWTEYGPTALELIVKQTTGKEIKSIGLLNNLNIQITEPIFLKPFDNKTILELLSGEVMIYMVLDYEQIINKFNAQGVTANWSSKKETHKLKDGNPYSREIITIENQAISISYKKHSLHLGSGFFVRIVSDNLKPNNAVNLFTEMVKSRKPYNLN